MSIIFLNSVLTPQKTLHVHYKHKSVTSSLEEEEMLFIVTVIRNTQIHRVGETRNFCVLELVVHIVTSVLMHNRSSMVAVQGPVLWPTLAYLPLCFRGLPNCKRFHVFGSDTVTTSSKDKHSYR
jgi:hypothetical protein